MAGSTLNPDELIRLAEDLRDLGVTEFSVGDVRIVFGGPVRTPVTVEALSKVAPPKAPAKSIYDVASNTWGPIKFPGQE